MKEISKAKRNEIIWHFFAHATAVFTLIGSFFYMKNPKLVEGFYYIIGFLRSSSHIYLKHLQIKNESYITINPVYLWPMGIATYIMALTSTAYFSMSNIAIFLVFQINSALMILFVNNTYLKVNTFIAEYFTVSLLLNLTLFSHRYDASRREIELFLLNKKIAAERSFF